MSSSGEIKACVFALHYPPHFGGMGFQIQRSIPYLRRNGVQPTILTVAVDGSPTETIGEEGEQLVRSLTLGADTTSRIRRILQVRRHFRDCAGRYDLVHSIVMGYEFLLNARYINRRGLPIVVEMVLLDGDDPLTLRRQRLGHLKVGLVRNVDAWIGISAAFRSRVAAAGIPDERFHLIYPGVDVERYRRCTSEERRAIRQKLDLPLEGRIVISVGSVMRRKGFDRVIRGWQRFAPRRDRDRLLIIGPASSAEGLRESEARYVDSLRALADAEPSRGTIQFLGFRQNVHDYMAASDLFVFLSRQEGLGIVTQEAMASGLPCVLSPLDGIADELIDEGETGFIARDPDDAEMIASLMTRLLSDDSSRYEMGERARGVATRRFSFETRSRAIAELYRSVREGGRQG